MHSGARYGWRPSRVPTGYWLLQLSHVVLISGVAGSSSTVAIENRWVQCFDDAVPFAERKNMVLDGVEMPIGIVAPAWGSSPILLAHLYRIIVEEKFGYKTIHDFTATASLASLIKLTGCQDSTGLCGKSKDAILPTVNQTMHVVQELWASALVTADFPAVLHEDIRPEYLGSVGYVGFEGLYASRSVREKAYLQDPMLVLEHYRSYNTSRTDLRQLFDGIDAVPDEHLQNCSYNKLHNNAVMQKYLEVTGDMDGLYEQDGKLFGRCWRDKWWLSPSCRQDVTRCIPVITSGATGWQFDTFMHQVTAQEVPVALAVAPWSDYLVVPRLAEVMFYWWEPDLTFIDMGPANVVFPPHKAGQWAAGDYRTAYDATTCMKFVHLKFKTAVGAWAAYTLAQRIGINKVTLDEMMVDVKSQNRGGQEELTACEWLKANTAVWDRWLVDPRMCRTGYGLVKSDGNFTSSFEDAKECAACSPGMVSLPVNSPKGLTYQCDACAEGTFTDSFMAVTCYSCDKGKFTGEKGLSSCSNCQMGRFQTELGKSECDACNATFATQILGASTLSACVCPRTTYYSHDGDKTCRPCSERTKIGLECPGGHSVTNPLRDTTPLVLDGFMSMADDPLSLYTCADVDACRGSRALEKMDEMCPPNYDLEVGQCARCKDGYYMENRVCIYCTGDNSGILMVIKLFLALLLQLGVVVYLIVRANRPQKMGLISMTLLVTFIQVLLQIMRLPLMWPTPLRSFFGEMEIFSVEGIFSLLTLQPACVVSGGFLSKIMFDAFMPGTAVFHILLLVGFTRLFRIDMPVDHAINTIALIYKGLFITIISMALQIFVPDVMPGGVEMVKMMPGLEIGSDTWNQGVPIALLSFVLYCVSFAAFVAHAVYVAPRWIATWPNFIRRYRFAFGALRPDRWWWCMVRIGYSLGLTVLQIVSRTVHMRIYLVTFLILSYTTMCYHYRPFKFEKCNQVDVVLQGSLVFFLFVAMSFIDNALIDPADLETTRHDLSIVACIFLAMAAMHAAQGFLVWLYSMWHPPATKMGNKLVLSNKFRDVATNILLLPDGQYNASILDLGEMDLKRLNEVVHTLVPEFLKTQPHTFPLKQRLVPDVPFRTWEEGAFSVETLKSTAEGTFNERVTMNARQRIRLLQLARDVTTATVGGQSLKPSVSQRSIRDIGLEKTVEGALNHVRAVFEDAGLAELTKEEYVAAQQSVTKLSAQDLEELFDFLDYRHRGFVSFDDVASAIIGVLPALGSNTEGLFEALTRPPKASSAAVEEKANGTHGIYSSEGPARFGQEDSPRTPTGFVVEEPLEPYEQAEVTDFSPLKIPDALNEQAKMFFEDGACDIDDFQPNNDGAGPEMSRHVRRTPPPRSPRQSMTPALTPRSQ
eukprot:TRINITY_DN3424_c0_g1_i4.p1 TRINITY_DN3424_c0_g1~~TRINITY_DN3424_c0_g1_i4.p1  ORF type:complete len:1379 (-),score=296.37 TRINITY_DN3424_c0_g1_i4:391-4527(-)